MLLRDCSDGWQAFSLSEVEHSPAAKQGSYMELRYWNLPWKLYRFASCQLCLFGIHWNGCLSFLAFLRLLLKIWSASHFAFWSAGRFSRNYQPISTFQTSIWFGLWYFLVFWRRPVSESLLREAVDWIHRIIGLGVGIRAIVFSGVPPTASVCWLANIDLTLEILDATFWSFLYEDIWWRFAFRW